MSTTPFRPLTREQAAEILSVSLGTLDTMIEDGVLPPPRQIGDCRKLYWHPDVFDGQLHRLLCVDPAPLDRPVPEPDKPSREPRRARHGVLSETAPVRGAATTAPPNARGYRDARTRQAERLQNLNR